MERFGDFESPRLSSERRRRLFLTGEIERLLPLRDSRVCDRRLRERERPKRIQFIQLNVVPKGFD